MLEAVMPAALGSPVCYQVSPQITPASCSVLFSLLVFLMQAYPWLSAMMGLWWWVQGLCHVQAAAVYA